MYTYINAMGPACSIFFVILQIFGKYVLLNLFLAILLENFEDIEIEQNHKETLNTQGSIKEGEIQGAPTINEATEGGDIIVRQIKEESMMAIIKSGILQMVQKKS